MQLKQSFIIAVILGVTAVTCWELFWRSQGRRPNLDDNKDLWAKQRSKLEGDHSKLTVFIGSSRILYDIQLDIWEDLTGYEPIMLAVQGASPLATFQDIVKNTDFSGTLMVGITPPLLFSTTYPMAEPMRRAISKVEYFEDRTYAQQINHELSVPLQTNLAFIRDGEEEWSTDVDLATLLRQIRIGERGGPTLPPFNNFEEITRNRHMRMPEYVTKDTAYANTIKTFWKALFTGGDMPPPDKEGTSTMFFELAKAFTERGGNLILLRCPSSGFFREVESKAFPRAEYWDPFVDAVGVPSYHFEDYEQFQNLFLPEWSHLSAEDAQFFTRELIEILKKDKVIPN